VAQKQSMEHEGSGRCAEVLYEKTIALLLQQREISRALNRLIKSRLFSFSEAFAEIAGGTQQVVSEQAFKAEMQRRGVNVSSQELRLITGRSYDAPDREVRYLRLLLHKEQLPGLLPDLQFEPILLRVREQIEEPKRGLEGRRRVCRITENVLRRSLRQRYRLPDEGGGTPTQARTDEFRGKAGCILCAGERQELQHFLQRT